MTDSYYCNECNMSVPSGKALLRDSGRRLECPNCGNDITPED